ncbi:sulfotransferase [Candidatus Entotheonella palauensis]|uniref:sulfotransferase n=1 Tax=Candidatus Entotheonella palauensis TaxID=93172 RepID=UPI000B7FD6A8|nr:sulfotransferase [Candidatus Entotheonella palauensis]
MILLLGSARSGTTWLAKIFDSHPDVLYRHEPDFTLTTTLPPFITADALDQYADSARDYLEQLCDVREPQVIAKRPLFPKRYRTSTQHLLWYSHLALATGLRRIPVLGTRLKASVPAYLNPEATVRPVIKSVMSMGRAGVYARAVAEGHVVIIIRHICGYVESVVRGVRLGKMPGALHLNMLASMPQAQRRGLSADRLRGMDLVEQCAWRWVLQNEIALETTRGLKNTMILKHDDLCDNPMAAAQKMFAFCGLDWNDQTATFIAASSGQSENGQYFSVYRSSADEAHKWRTSLTREEQKRILAIAHASELAAFLQS